MTRIFAPSIPQLTDNFAWSRYYALFVDDRAVAVERHESDKLFEAIGPPSELAGRQHDVAEPAADVLIVLAVVALELAKQRICGLAEAGDEGKQVCAGVEREQVEDDGVLGLVHSRFV